jgi:sulfate adenylyltransferase
MIGIGAFSPLTGFMGSKDFDSSICSDMKMADGNIWPIPILLSVGARPTPRRAIAWRCYAPNGVLQAVMTVEEVFAHDRKTEATVFFNKPEDDDGKHPGAEMVKAEGDPAWPVRSRSCRRALTPTGPRRSSTSG